MVNIRSRAPRVFARALGRTRANGSNSAASARVSERLIAAAQCETIEQVFELLGTTPLGLTSTEVRRRTEQYGLNEIAHDKPPAWYVQLGQAFLNPFIGVLVALIVASLFLDVLL